MPKKKKTLDEKIEEALNTEVDIMANSTNPDLKLEYPQELTPLGLNLDLGRQDLNENFLKIQEKMNEIIKKVK